MIIAIDETGDFTPESEKLSFFIAALIPQQKADEPINQTQFLKWLKSIPDEKLNKNGEVKGSDLTDEELLTFVNQVYYSNIGICCEVVCFQPNENPESLMKKYKQIELARISRKVDFAKDSGKDDIVKLYEGLAIWYKNAKKMNYQHYFKLILLRRLILKSFRKVAKLSLLPETSDFKTLEKYFNIKIDKDFIRGVDSTKYWKELLKTHFWVNLNKKPLPQSFKLNWDDIISEKCNFVESHEHFEVQIADIIGIIINRFLNRNKAVEAFKKLESNLENISFTKISLKPNPNETNIEPITIKNYKP